jgi:phosphohistidine swiveling domain-containing protein
MFDKAFCAGVLQSQHYRVSSDALDSLWERATEPAFESFDKSQLLDIAVQMRAGTSQETIIEHCQYFMTDYHSAKPLVDVEAILKERYADIWDNPEAATAVVARETATQESVMHAHDEWLGTLAEQERMIANYIQLVMRIRDRRKNFFAKGMTIFYRVAERMFREAGIDRDLIPYYTVRELLQGIEYLNVVREELFDRPQGFQWFVPYTGLPQKLNRSIDDGVDLINRAFTDGHTVGAEADLVRGQAGFRGVVRGRVRVVLDMNANHGFQLGEILVTGMTRPEYVPLMRLALAIVTDEGGITCHAAIVSRELKKPCIIGTKIATQVLHDGDLVEVDADAGVVRVIEQATE